MKKTVLCLILIALFLIGGCASKETSKDLSLTNNDIRKDPPKSIAVHSLEQLDEMRAMAQSSDEDALREYLCSIEGGGANSRKDLIEFVDMIDSLPVVDLIEGDITWICNSIDTEKGTHVVFITLKAADGRWTRLEYNLSENDVDAKIKQNITEGAAEIKNVKSSDGKIIAFTEKKEAHPSGAGELYTWNVTINEILTNVAYYTPKENNINISELIKDIQVMTIKELSIKK